MNVSKNKRGEILMTKKAKKTQNTTKSTKKSGSRVKKTKKASSAKAKDSKVSAELEESFQGQDIGSSPQKGCHVWPIISIVLAVILIAVVASFPYMGEEGEDEEQRNEFIFVESVTCDEACEQMEPIAREVSELADLEFRKIGLDEDIPVPGYMVILDKEAKTFLEAIEGEQRFYQEMCEVTGNQDVCMKAEGESSSVDDGVTDMAEFNQCLAEEGMTIYGMEWCPDCKDLVESLGGAQAVEPVYVECTKPENEQKCHEERQGADVPEIQIDGELYNGERSPERLAEVTGCKL